MTNLIGSFLEGRKEILYLVFRILVGGLFMQHGAQKLLGAFGSEPAAMFSMFWIGGLVELFGGAAVAIGLFTRLGAVLPAIQMAFAYVYFHLPNGWVPIENKGELALLYLAAFLVISYRGSGKYSVESIFNKKSEIF
jgi:putative oxidoreductase